MQLVLAENRNGFSGFPRWHGWMTDECAASGEQPRRRRSACERVCVCTARPHQQQQQQQQSASLEKVEIGNPKKDVEVRLTDPARQPTLHTQPCLCPLRLCVLLCCVPPSALYEITHTLARIWPFLSLASIFAHNLADPDIACLLRALF